MLASWKESYDKPRPRCKKPTHHFADKGLSSQSYGFTSSPYMDVRKKKDSAKSCPALCNPMAPLHMGFSGQESWNGLPFPSPGDLPDPILNPGLSHYRHMLYRLTYKGSPKES